MSESRRASVSFTAMPPSVLSNHSRHISDEDIQITLAPCIQTYLSQTGRRHSCCSVMLPVAFERAAPKSWLNPCFDSQVLEGQYQASVFPQIRLRFKFALFYILLCSLVWMIYFLNGGATQHHWIPLSIVFGLIILLSGLLLWLTQSDFYRAHTHVISGSTAIIISIASLCFLSLTSNAFSPLGHFAICIEIILLIYTVIPLRLWQNICIATLYSITFELLTHFLGNNHYFNEKPDGFCYKIFALRSLLQICVHLVGVHVLIMNIVRMRGTFMKIGQNLLVRRQLEMEKQLKEKMIHSVMPPKVADMLLKEGGPQTMDSSDSNKPSKQVIQRYRVSNDITSLFRPFHMHSMDNVSILFADIVGFTKMSSTKTAEQLVEILNDLFERFDDLCLSSGCEKISTLGDCYYCVSGCPEPRPDHAICCVEMGLDMIAAMEKFDAQRHEGVTMRVGVHTGTVLCGIVGTRRVKFDVWSNDVTLANRMESTGRPAQVHISSETCSFLGDSYILEEGDDVNGCRTYFVLSRKRDYVHSSSFRISRTDLLTPDPYLLLLTNPSITSNDDGGGGAGGRGGGGAGGRGGDGGSYASDVHLSQSATNLSATQPTVPPASPVGQTSSSLNPSPLLSIRPRLSSFGKVTKYATNNGNNNSDNYNSDNYNNNNNNNNNYNNKLYGNNNKLQKDQPKHPKIIITTKSLPGSLDSDNVQSNSVGNDDIETEGINDAHGISNSLSTKYIDSKENENITNKSKFLNWKVPKFLRKIDIHHHHHQNNQNNDNLTSVTINVSDTIQKSRNNSNNNLLKNDTQYLDSNGGYQPLPIVIETTCPNNTTNLNTLDVPSMHRLNSNSNSRSPDSTSCSPGQHSIFDDIIDVRSYISQSRSDISPFARSNSYKSQCGGGGNSGDLSPNLINGRPRASTVVYQQCDSNHCHLNTNPSHHHHHHHQQQQQQHHNNKFNWNGCDGLSTCPSATSRKDSGIRSNSRRSSIHQQFFGGTTATPIITTTTTATATSTIIPPIEIVEHTPEQFKHSHENQQKLQRVSGYFTSSQSSIADLPEPTASFQNQHYYVPHPDPLGACLQKLRKQSDLQLIRCVRDNAKSQRNYLVKPPISDFTLFFRSSQMEKEFRSKAHRFGNESETDSEGPPTLATPKYNTYIDIFVGMLIYFAISASIFLLSSSSSTTTSSTIEFSCPFRIWLSLFIIFSILQFFTLYLFTKQMCRRRGSITGGRDNNNEDDDKHLQSKNATTEHKLLMKLTCADHIFQGISGWYPWHICLAILMSLPVILIIVNFSLQDFGKLAAFEYHYGFLIFVCIVHFCNFTQLNCWIRNILAMLCALAFVGIALGQMDAITSYRILNDTVVTRTTTTLSPSPQLPIDFIPNKFVVNDYETTTLPSIYIFDKDEFIVRENFPILSPLFLSSSLSSSAPSSSSSVNSTPYEIINTRTTKLNWFQEYHVEIYLDLMLVLVLVWFLNREFEIGYRLTFYGNAVANQDKIRVQNMKNQADMLLHNIIPKHVAEQLKNTAKYSENHHNIGIIFASIINFNELYDESYLGGKEYLRVLNELIGDFDELLCREEFCCVEKIKTIGSTFMAASGLDPYTRTDNDNEHIQTLMHFAIAMQEVVAAFNNDLLEFDLILRIGFNVGDVTAGVIGTSKLHYDIWGDAVNVASRMDTTGVASNIQIGKNCIPFLESSFEFESRGTVYVKGKDHMEVFLLKKKSTNLNNNQNIN